MTRFVDVFDQPLTLVVARLAADSDFDWSSVIGRNVDVVTSQSQHIKTPLENPIIQFMEVGADSVEVGLGDWGGVISAGVKQATKGWLLRYRVATIADRATGGEETVRKLSSMLARFFFANQGYFRQQGLFKLGLTGGTIMDWAEEGFDAMMHTLEFYVEHDRVLT